MADSTPPRRTVFFCSIALKYVALFLIILLVAVVPLAVRYYQDSRDYEIKVLASQLEFFAERGSAWIDVEAVHSLRTRADMRRKDYREVVAALTRIEKEFGVDNAVIMRRREDGSYIYVAVGESLRGAGAKKGAPASNPCSPGAAVSNPCSPGAASNPCSPGAASNPCSPGATGGSIFDIGRPVHIHANFPATYMSTENTWQAGRMMHSQLFGGEVGGRRFDEFLQVNTPLKLNGRVVAILMLNKFANPVAARVRAKAIYLFGLTAAVVLIGLVLFGAASSRMLRMLRSLTAAAAEVTRGNLEVTLPARRSADEVGRLADAFESMLEGLRQRDFIRDTFGRYISEEVVDELLSSPDGLRLGGELREVTFLVSDLRGFTAMSSKMSPDEVIRIVNRYLGRMVDIISRYEGTVDEFQGDGILAFFGAPIARDDDPERAVACAIEMQRALAEINEELRRQGLPDLNMGIGVTTGEVIVGNIGSEKRAKYGAMGTPINTAYRIESNTVSGQILIGPETYERVREVVQVGGFQELRFKGLDAPVRVYEVTGLTGEYAATLPEREAEAFTPLAEPLAVECFPLEGKTVSAQAIGGRITCLSERSAEVALDAPVAASANLLLRVAAPSGNGELPDLYAKVRGPAGEGVCLSFTSLPAEAKAFFDRLRAAASRG